MDPEGGHPMWLAGLVPPPPGLSYEVLVDGREYEYGVFYEDQWRVNAFSTILEPLIESTEPAHFPRSYYEEVTRRFAGQPALIERYTKGVHDAALALSCPLRICVEGYTSTFPNGVMVDWIFAEKAIDCRMRVSKIEAATAAGVFQPDGFEALFSSRGILGLGPSTQLQRWRYADGVLKFAFRGFLPDALRQKITTLVVPQYPKFMGTPYDEILSHNAGEEPKVFAARMESLRDALLRFEEDAKIVRDLLKGTGSVFALACSFGDRDPFDMSGNPGWHSAPCGHGGEDSPTWYSGTRSDEPLALPAGTSWTDRMTQAHQNNLPAVVWNEDFHIVTGPANDHWNYRCEELGLIPPSVEPCHCALKTYKFRFGGIDIPTAALGVVTASDLYVVSQFTRKLAGHTRFSLTEDYIHIQMECAHPETCRAQAWDDSLLMTKDDYNLQQDERKAQSAHLEGVSSLRILAGYISDRAQFSSPWAASSLQQFDRRCRFREVLADGWSVSLPVPVALHALPPVPIDLISSSDEEDVPPPDEDVPPPDNDKDDGWGVYSKQLGKRPLPSGDMKDDNVDDGWGGQGAAKKPDPPPGWGSHGSQDIEDDRDTGWIIPPSRTTNPREVNIQGLMRMGESSPVPAPNPYAIFPAPSQGGSRLWSDRGDGNEGGGPSTRVRNLRDSDEKVAQYFSRQPQVSEGWKPALLSRLGDPSDESWSAPGPDRYLAGRVPWYQRDPMISELGYQPRGGFLPFHDPKVILSSIAPGKQAVIMENFLGLLAPLGNKWKSDPHRCEALETIDLAMAIADLMLRFPVLEPRNMNCFIRLVFERDLLTSNKLRPRLRSMVAGDLERSMVSGDSDRDRFRPYDVYVPPQDSSSANRGRRVPHFWKPLLQTYRWTSGGLSGP